MSRPTTVKRPKNAKDVKKIKVRYVDKEIYSTKGLFDGGCLNASCEDICCEYGCDVDFATLKLIYKYRRYIEPRIKRNIENCFSTPLKVDDDYIGGAYRETAVRETNERCAFHLIDKRGCVLFTLWREKGLPKRIVPTICRSYPITWHRGRLFVDRPLRKTCKCLEKTPASLKNKGLETPSLFETQKKEIKALFDICPPKRKPKGKKRVAGRSAKRC